MRWERVSYCRACNTEASGTEGQLVRRNGKKVGVVGAKTLAAR
jgi:hypothetical protein